MEMNALNAHWNPPLDCDHEKDYTKEGKALCYIYYKHEEKKKKCYVKYIMNSRTDLFLILLRCNQKNSHYFFFFPLKLSCIRAPGNKETFELRIQVFPLPPLA